MVFIKNKTKTVLFYKPCYPTQFKPRRIAVTARRFNLFTQAFRLLRILRRYKPYLRSR